jgi:putative colanic acid biosynthesis glycosyltransferase
MNKGTARARGKYVVYLNGGDAFSDAECLADVRRALEQAGWPELCYGGGNWAFADGHRKYRAPRSMARAIRHGLPGLHQATFYRREFLDVPPYDLNYPVSADYFVSARCFVRGARACYVHRALADFGVGGNSMKKAAASRREAWDIQRDVLKLSWPERALSASRRYAASRTLELMHYFMHPSKKTAAK